MIDECDFEGIAGREWLNVDRPPMSALLLGTKSTLFALVYCCYTACCRAEFNATGVFGVKRIACMCGSTRHSVKDVFAFLWEHAVFRYRLNGNSWTDHSEIWHIWLRQQDKDVHEAFQAKTEAMGPETEAKLKTETRLRRLIPEAGRSIFSYGLSLLKACQKHHLSYETCTPDDFYNLSTDWLWTCVCIGLDM